MRHPPRSVLLAEAGTAALIGSMVVPAPRTEEGTATRTLESSVTRRQDPYINNSSGRTAVHATRRKTPTGMSYGSSLRTSAADTFKDRRSSVFGLFNGPCPDRAASTATHFADRAGKAFHDRELPVPNGVWNTWERSP